MAPSPDRVVAVETVCVVGTLALVARTESMGLWLAWAVASVAVAGVTLVWLNR